MQRILNKSYILTGFLLVMLFSAGCKKEKIVQVEVKDYYERIRFVIEGNADYAGYTKYVAAAGLLDTMATQGPFSLCISDLYLYFLDGRITVTPEEATPVIHYQAMRGVRRLDTLPLQANQPIPTMLGKDLYVSRYAIPNSAGGKDTVTSINGTLVTQGNIRASNGIIHVLEHLVAPPQFSTLYDKLLSQQDLRFMAVIVDRLNMKSLLQDKGPYTFFVPTNYAFSSDPALADLGIRTIDDVYTVDTVVLGNLVRTHLLRGMQFKKDFMWQYFANGKNSYTALSGKTITVSDPSDWSVNLSAPGNTYPVQLPLTTDYSNPVEGFLTGNGVLIMLNSALIP